MTYRIRGVTALIAALLAIGLATPAAFATSGLTADGFVAVESEEGAGWDNAIGIDYAPKEFAGSLYWTAQELTGAAEYWNDGHIGTGVDIAIIDTGVTAVPGLTYPGKLLHGPDLSFESQDDDLRHRDNNGHGTHLAGIMAGRDLEATTVQKGDEAHFLGMAPGARVVNVKVGTRTGAVDVSQVIAAIEWVVDHRQDGDLDIRVLNLAFGTDSVQPWELDPLAYAVQYAWDNGIVVVVAAGNDGNDEFLRNPAINPYVIAVGASEGNETYGATDDLLAEFSNCGNAHRPVDLLAPGRSLVSLRSPGSEADVNYPEARIGRRFFVGSGTSQSAAVVSGAAALVIDQRPDITPDQLKSLLQASAQPLPGVVEACQGAGLIDLKSARDLPTPVGTQSHGSALGIGTIEGARGSAHIALDDQVLEGEQDIFGNLWLPCGKTSLAEIEFDDDDSSDSLSSVGDLWWGARSSEDDDESDESEGYPPCAQAITSHWQADGYWNGAQWTGVTWSGVTWSAVTWSGVTWSGVTWSSVTWSGVTWSAVTWSGDAWN